MNRRRTFRSTALVLSLLAAGPGMSFLAIPANAAVAGVEGPWSTLVAGGIPSGVEDFVPVIVSSIDGEVPTLRSVNVAPGRKQILLDTASQPNSRGPTHKRLELTMEPCMRYFVAGRKPSPLSLRWEPIVFRTEAMGECAAEFKIKVTEPAAPQAMQKEPVRPAHQ